MGTLTISFKHCKAENITQNYVAIILVSINIVILLWFCNVGVILTTYNIRPDEIYNTHFFIVI